ncbi:MAG: hypothetical protein VKJ86_02100 [Synechococcus sp.]|nr:hypothetical protein [Synechococcus sp.]
MDKLIHTLIQAGLLTEVQAQVARHDLQVHPEMSLGDVLSLRGWAAEETIDFFELLWELRHSQPERSKIGQYLLEAHLITQEQLEDILQSQKHDTWGRSLRFGEIAVLKGYVKPNTMRFFVEHLFPDQLHKTTQNPFSRTSSTTRPTETTDPTQRQTNTAKETHTTTLTEKHQTQPSKSSQNLLSRFTAKMTLPRRTFPTNPTLGVDLEEAFSTSFDLANADDFDLGQF